jgi:hypothetical protein
MHGTQESLFAAIAKPCHILLSVTGKKATIMDENGITPLSPEEKALAEERRRNDRRNQQEYRNEPGHADPAHLAKGPKDR